MPYDEVMGKFKQGQLHSGSKSGPPVRNPKQAVAIMLAEKAKADQGGPDGDEYAAAGAPAAGKRGQPRRKAGPPLAGLKKAGL